MQYEGESIAVGGESVGKNVNFNNIIEKNQGEIVVILKEEKDIQTSL